MSKKQTEVINLRQVINDFVLGWSAERAKRNNKKDPLTDRIEKDTLLYRLDFLTDSEIELIMGQKKEILLIIAYFSQWVDINNKLAKQRKETEYKKSIEKTITQLKSFIDLYKAKKSRRLVIKSDMEQTILDAEKLLNELCKKSEFLKSVERIAKNKSININEFDESMFKTLSKINGFDKTANTTKKQMFAIVDFRKYLEKILNLTYS